MKCARATAWTDSYLGMAFSSWPYMNDIVADSGGVRRARGKCRVNHDFSQRTVFFFSPTAGKKKLKNAKGGTSSFRRKKHGG